MCGSQKKDDEARLGRPVARASMQGPGRESWQLRVAGVFTGNTREVLGLGWGRPKDSIFMGLEEICCCLCVFCGAVIEARATQISIISVLSEAMG